MAQYLNDDQFDEVLTKLFESVGKKFHSIGRSCKGQWYMRNTWNKEQEKEFGQWLTKYVAKKLRISIKQAKKRAQMFCFEYGWKYKDEKALK